MCSGVAFSSGRGDLGLISNEPLCSVRIRQAVSPMTKKAVMCQRTGPSGGREALHEVVAAEAHIRSGTGCN